MSAPVLVVPDYMQAFYTAWQARNPAPPAQFCHGCGAELTRWAREHGYAHCSKACREAAA